VGARPPPAGRGLLDTLGLVGHSCAVGAGAGGRLAHQAPWSNIVTYFRHSITNAVREGLNSKIQTIKKMAYGFRNQEHFKTAPYFHCGGLDLYPRFPEEPKKKIATTPAIAASATTT